MEFTKELKGYVLIDPITNIPRYVGITRKSLKQRFSGHVSDIYSRPDLNPHKTAWFKKLFKIGKIPIIKQIAEFDTVEEMKQFEIDYIKLYKEEYKLINLTPGGDYFGLNAHSRETILKRKSTRQVVQYNILGEKIAEYEIMEDIGRTLNLKEKACSHITQCCKGTRRHAYGYIWRYKGDDLGDLSDINPKSLYFNKLVQYNEFGDRIAEYSSYIEASKAIGDKSKGGNIASVVNGKQVSCMGYYFQVEPIYCYFDQDLFDKVYSKTWSPGLDKKNKQGKTVLQIDQNGIIVAEYNSLSLAADTITGKPGSSGRSQISKCCKDQNLTYKGFFWRFKEESSLNPSNSEENSSSQFGAKEKCETTIENTSENDGSEQSTSQANGDGNGGNLEINYDIV